MSETGEPDADEKQIGKGVGDLYALRRSIQLALNAIELDLTWGPGTDWRAEEQMNSGAMERFQDIETLARMAVSICDGLYRVLVRKAAR